MADLQHEPLAGFVGRLQDLRSRAGQPSLSLLEQITGQAGHRLPRSTLHQKLRCESPPDWPFVDAFVRACRAHAQRNRIPLAHEDADLNAWRRAHQHLLAALAAARPAQRLARAAQAQIDEETGPPTVPPVPRQLPPNVHSFVGRDDQLVELDGLLNRVDHPTVPIAAVCGMPGVGKTGLMLHWAYRVAGEFPDGQLYLDLRGFDPAQPLTPGEALAAMLRALGVSGSDIPYELAERAAHYRTAVAGKRLLILLDNARDSDHARQLLPGSTSCLVVVTSRSRLGALVARDGAHRIYLDPLPVPSCIRLLDRLLGQRVVDDPAAVEALAERCGRLPLALRVAAELAADRADTTVTDLLDELADEERRPGLLDAGEDQRTAVRQVFSWSYRHLPAPAARALRLLGLHPGPDIDLSAAAALLGTGPGETQRLVEVLAAGHLLEHRSTRRYGMHDLLRRYAAQLAGAEDLDVDRQDCLTRLLNHYVDLAAVLAVDTSGQPWTLLDADLPNLVASAAFAAGNGWPGHAIAISLALADRLYLGARYSEASAIHGHALRAAQRIGDRLAEAHAHRRLSAVFRQWGSYEPALDHGERALSLYRLLGDQAGEAEALKSLGLVYQRLGRYDEAAEWHHQSHQLAEKLGDQLTSARALGNLAIVHDLSGRYREAVAYYQQALTVFRQLGNRSGEGKTLGNLGIVYGRWGHRAGSDLSPGVPRHCPRGG